ncbi:hypothetical protein MMC07_007395 [Pseudocyphellaria aurata]|nr:hypothetical protein [Pseudocyphellaria aurata]
MNAVADTDAELSSPSSLATVLADVRADWDRMKPLSPIYRFLLEDIAIVAAEPGHITALLHVAPVHLNSKGTLHGSVSTALTDWAGGLAIKSTGAASTGLSTDIHTTFVSTARIGDWLEIEGRASKVGASLAFTTVEIRKAVVGNGAAVGSQRGPVVSTGTHTKYIKQ